MLKKIHILMMGLFFMCGCGEDRLVGTWLQPIPGMESQQQGITLHNDGSASSVNMHTLVYEAWKKDGNHLLLTAKSIGNGQTIDVEENFVIKKLDDRELVLQLGGMIVSYTRKQ